MKKTIKISSIIVISLLLLISITAVILTFAIDPNKFKGKISQLVFAKTGQVLVINGDMRWSFFPWVGIKANNLTYYNTPAFKPKVLASAKEMDVKIKLIPLLNRQVEVGNITFNHLVLNLIKDQQGKYNWETLTTKNIDKESAQNNNHSSDHSNALSKMMITSFKIKDGIVNWHDQKEHQKYTLNNFTLNSKDIAINHSFPLSMSFTALDKNAQAIAEINLNSKLTINPKSQQYFLQKFKLDGYLFDKKYADGKIPFSSSSDVNMDLEKQILSSENNFSLANMEGKMKITGQQISKNPSFTGEVDIDTFNINDLLKKLGQADVPLKKLALNTQIQFNNSQLKFDQLNIKTDQATISGRTNIQLRNKTVDFNLTSKEIDLNQLMSEKTDSTNKSELANSDTQEATTSAQPKKTNDWRMHGNIHIDKLAVKKLQLSNMTTTVSYKNDIIELSPFHADLYRGEANGSMVIDKRDNGKTVITIKQFINSVDLKEMLQQVADSQKLSGTANITANLTSVITSKINFLAGLNGSLQMLIKNGSLQGIDVTYQISRAHGFIKHFEKTNVENTKETPFKELTASAQITNGVLDNKDLIISSDYLKVNGKGSLNFDKNDINYYLKALASPKLAQAKNLEKEIITYEIPIKVSGSLSKPSVNLDFAELTKTIYQRQIQKPLQDHVGKNIVNIKDNLKEKIKDKLHINILDKL